MDTTARDELEAAMGARGWSQSELARRLRCDPAAVNRWMNKRSRPSLTMRRAIESLLSIDESGWLTPDELSHLASVTEGAA